MKILDYIPVGRDNSIPMKTLAERLNVSERAVRMLVQREREKGAPICSDFQNSGYYIPVAESEARAYYRQQRARIRSANAALNGVRKLLKGGGKNE